MSSDLKRIDAGEQGINPTTSIGQILAAVAEKGITPDAVQSVRELAQIHREMRADTAREVFAQAFADFQSECPKVVTTKVVPTKAGGVKFKYAPYEDILEAIGPILAKHGFSVSYSTDYRSEPIRVVAICTLTHIQGHEKSSEFSCRIGGGAPGLSAAQEDGAAATTAIRRAFCSICNIVVTNDTDARNEGETITPAEALEIQGWASRVAGGEVQQIARYLGIAGADKWTDIRRARYDVLVQQLERDEAKTASPAPAAKQQTEPTPAPAKQGKPFPASFDDGGAWREAMRTEMESRWGCTPAAAGKVLDAMIVQSGASSYLALSPERRKDAWNRLVNGALDARAPK